MSPDLRLIYPHVRAILERAREFDPLDYDEPKVIAACAAALEGMALESGWRSIDTAKKDGRLLLLFDGSELQFGRWHDPSERWLIYDGMGDMHPTHWKPLPALPDEQPPSSDAVDPVGGSDHEPTPRDSKSLSLNDFSHGATPPEDQPTPRTDERSS